MNKTSVHITKLIDEIGKDIDDLRKLDTFIKLNCVHISSDNDRLAYRELIQRQIRILSGVYREATGEDYPTPNS